MNKINLSLKILLAICLILFFFSISVIILNTHFLIPINGIATISDKYISQSKNSFFACGRAMCPISTPRRYWIELTIDNQIDYISVSQDKFNNLEVNQHINVVYSYTRFNREIVINNIID